MVHSRALCTSLFQSRGSSCTPSAHAIKSDLTWTSTRGARACCMCARQTALPQDIMCAAGRS
eukprot:11307237-Prorocentrum_lima.AAC.1